MGMPAAKRRLPATPLSQKRALKLQGAQAYTDGGSAASGGACGESVSAAGAGTLGLRDSGSSTTIASGLIAVEAARVRDQLLPSKDCFVEAADAFAADVGKEIRLLHASLEEARQAAASVRESE